MLQRPILSGLTFVSSPVTLVDRVQSLLGQKTHGRSRHLQDLCLEVNPDLFIVVGIVRFAEPFRKFQLVLLSNVLVQNGAIQPDWAGWRHLTRLELNFQSSYEKSVVGSGRLDAPEIPEVVDKYPATLCEYMADFFPCTIAIKVLSPAVQVRPSEPRSSYHQSPTFRNGKEH